MTLRLRLATGLLLVLAAPAGPAFAQGTLSGQGFGYPTGQLSTGALGSAGAMGEFDPFSPINPAALGSLAPWRRASFFFQYDPEFRRVSSGGQTQSAMLARFPVVQAAVPIGRRGELALGASTYLDRTFSTTVATTTQIGTEQIGTTERIESRGSIADVRLGGAWVFANALRVGVAGHVLSGENRLVSARVFEDTARFGSVADSSVLDYSGIAASAGVEWRPVRGFALAGSYRIGGTLRTEREDTTVTRADAPDRMGVSVRVDRITGAAIGASWSRTNWSNMRALGSSALRVRDATEFAVGAEIIGPRYGENVVLVRLGGRQRELPFGVGSADVRERAFSAGVGAPLGGGRALIDFAIQHATRSAHGTLGAGATPTERALTLSFGFTVRP
jgi:hypothetical protein